jgi:hypothetical protein
MSYEGLLVSLILAAVVVLVIAAPLIRRNTRRASSDTQLLKQRDRLLVYYERVLTNIRDLDEDHATGKMLDDDYTTEREVWVQRGIQVLKALDELEAGSPILDMDDAAVDEAIDDALEAAIQAYKNQSRAANS